MHLYAAKLCHVDRLFYALNGIRHQYIFWPSWTMQNNYFSYVNSQYINIPRFWVVHQFPSENRKFPQGWTVSTARTAGLQHSFSNCYSRQLNSSEPSMQSLSPSQCHSLSMHWWSSLQRNSSARHDRFWPAASEKHSRANISHSN